MRLFDLVLAILVVLALVLIARKEFPHYAGRTYGAPPAPAASPVLPPPTP